MNNELQIETTILAKILDICIITMNRKYYNRRRIMAT
jgi:hypothetical protein